MSALRNFQTRYTVSDYQSWQGDWELWDGTAVSMSPSPFGRHSALMTRLIAQLVAGIEARECNAEVLTELDWIVSDTTVVRPDVLVVCHAPPDRHLHAVPSFVAEILSEPTRERDVTFKRDLYLQEGVGTYLVVDPDSNELIRFGGTNDLVNGEKVLTATLHLTICNDCSVELDLKKLFR